MTCRFRPLLAVLMLVGLLTLAPRLAGAAEPDAAQPVSVADDRAWLAWERLPYEIKAKVDPRILAELRGEVSPAHLNDSSQATTIDPLRPRPLARTRFLVYLQHQPDLAALEQQVYASHVQRRAALLDMLATDAQATQAGVRATLDVAGVQAVAAYQPFFIVNVLAVEANLATIVELAQRIDVARIVANYPLALLQESSGPPLEQGLDQAEVHGARLEPQNWNIGRVGADRVWNELGVRGEGAVVAGFDTGVAWQHPALGSAYRGRLPNGSVEHNYNWFEPDTTLYTNGNLGPSLSLQPYDCNGHGSHTMGTMVGDGGEPGTQVGMAPGATWIALPGICSNTMPSGIRDDIGALKAFQWLLCPTDLSGDLATADCSKAPDVVNNSWGSANPVGDVLRPALQRLRAAGIAPVFAAGNPGAGDGSISSPGNAPEAITVGATDRTDRIASFSGRGPSVYAGEQKPELSAPGVDVYSVYATSSYEYGSGTSMAAPHVAGLVALMVSADLKDGRRDLTVDEFERFMAYSALDLGPPGPDWAYGHGRIRAFDAVRWVLEAGDLQGAVRDAAAGLPLVGVAVSGVDAGGRQFSTQTNAQGVYSTTAPAGSYTVMVQAWGYEPAQFAGQWVFADSQSLADFALTPLPVTILNGVVRSGGAPVADALVAVADQPARQTRTDAGGAFSLPLPTGAHTLVIQAPRHQVARSPVTVGTDTPAQEFNLTPAPSVLLVEADAAGGWFFGWPVAEFFRGSLDEQGYQYDEWPVQYTTITDTTSLPDGSVGYGIPSLATLRGYDLVIWAHSGCSPYGGCSHGVSDINLLAYLAQGGRLIYSGQDAGMLDGTPFYDEQLNSDVVSYFAAGEGDVLQGADFLQGIALTITNASLYGYNNGVVSLGPDAVTPQGNHGGAFPVLLYDNQMGAAALAVQPCGQSTRTVYLAMGYENIGRRNPGQNPAFAEVLSRSIDWVMGERSPRAYGLAIPQQMAAATPGGVARFPVQITNTGRDPIVLTLSLEGHQWPTRLVIGDADAGPTLALAPCQVADLAVLTTLPDGTANGVSDTAMLVIADAEGAAESQRTALITWAAAPWAREQGQSSSRFRMGVAAPDDRYLYVLGGLLNTNDLFYPITTSSVERYDSCTRAWETMPALPTPRSHLAAAAVGGKIYVVGGYENDFVYPYPTETALAYDTASGTWSNVASLPAGVAGAAAADANGKLYIFGGEGFVGYAFDHTWEYDPAADTWQARAPMPGGGRRYAAAAFHNGKIYVAGGWPQERTVEVYDPASDSWAVAPPLNQGRHSAALVAGGDGALYIIGGGTRRNALATTERFDAQAGAWQAAASLADTNRQGMGAAYAGGRIFAIGGQWSAQIESMQAGHSFCLSKMYAPNAAVSPGVPVTYAIELAADTINLPDVRVVNALPPQLRFAGFAQNTIGAVYNAGAHQVEWSGALAAFTSPPPLLYHAELASDGWESGDELWSAATFTIGGGVAFTRTTAVIALAADFTHSNLTADRTRVKSGDPITMTVHLESANLAGGALTVAAPLPAEMTYVADSLHYPFGVGSYDAETRTLHWQGTVPSGELRESEANYTWGDSEGRGENLATTFAWEAVGPGSASLPGGDDLYTCGLPIGFDFSFYGVKQQQFCASTNGFLAFDPMSSSSFINQCPLPNPMSINNIIAVVWDDLIVEKMAYETRGQAPNRRLVFTWQGARRFGAFTGRLAEFQVILYERGPIKMQYRDAGTLTGADSTTGLENQTGTVGVNYACNQPRTLTDELAILYTLNFGSRAVTEISYQATSAANLGVNRWVTTTTTIVAPQGVLQRSATILVNPLDLSASTVTLSTDQALPNEAVGYSIVLHNTGLVDAAASFTARIPPATTLVADSLSCSDGQCANSDDVLVWSGLLRSAERVTIGYRLRLTTPQRDRTPVVSDMQIDDGAGGVYTRTATFLARRSDVSATSVQVRPFYVDPGGVVTVLLLARNNGALATNTRVEHHTPDQLLAEPGTVTCSIGNCTLDDGVLRWDGLLPARSVAQISYRVRVPLTAVYGNIFTIGATVEDQDWDERFTAETRLWVARPTHMPLLMQVASPGDLVVAAALEPEEPTPAPVTLTFVRHE